MESTIPIEKIQPKDNQPQQSVHQQLPHKHQEDKICVFCLEKVEAATFGEHQGICKQKYQKLMEDQLINCTICSAQLLQQQFEQHKNTCKALIFKCRNCNQSMDRPVDEEHRAICPFRKRTPFQRQMQVQEYIPQYYKGNICYWCSQQIPRDQLDDHKYICEQKLQINECLLNYKLTSVEYNAIAYLYRKSAISHLESKESALTAVFNMGYSQGDLLLMSQFIEFQAPLIIHVELLRDIQYFIKDTEYRNLFETHKSGGSHSVEKRKKWECYLFGSAYNNCKPCQRVKYGVMNYANDKYGSIKCQKYGRSIIVLKESLRNRCTIAHQRVYGRGEIVCTLKHNYPIIEKCTQKELRVLYHASKGFQVESSDLQSFKEIHIHGPIRFQTDVQCIYTSEAQRQRNIDHVNTFENKFGVKIIALQDLQDQQW